MKKIQTKYNKIIHTKKQGKNLKNLIRLKLSQECLFMIPNWSEYLVGLIPIVAFSVSGKEYLPWFKLKEEFDTTTGY